MLPIVTDIKDSFARRDRHIRWISRLARLALLAGIVTALAL